VRANLWFRGGKALTEELNRLSKKKQRRVLGRDSERGLGRSVDLLAGDAKPFCHKCGIVQVKISPTAELGDNEVEGCQKPYA